MCKKYGENTTPSLLSPSRRHKSGSFVLDSTCPNLLTKARVESSDSVDINQKVTKLGLRYLYLAKSDLH